MDVTPQKLKEELKTDKRITIVDLQAAHEYEHSHIPGAVNIPLDKFEEEYPHVLHDKDEIIVVYGEYDELHKGSDACKILEAAGYEKVGHVVGGIHGWKDAGFPAEGGRES